MFTHAAIKAGAMCANLTWCIVRSVQDLEATRAAQKVKYYLDTIYAAIFSHVPWTNSLTSPRVAVSPVPHAPDPALASPVFFLGLLWANVYWYTSLVFSFGAIFFAVIVKQNARYRRVVLQRHGRPSVNLRARMQESFDEDAEAWLVSVMTDAMNRLFHVSFVVFLLGHVDSPLCPVGAMIFIPTVICSLLYVLGTIGPVVNSV